MTTAHDYDPTFDGEPSSMNPCRACGNGPHPNSNGDRFWLSQGGYGGQEAIIAGPYSSIEAAEVARKTPERLKWYRPSLGKVVVLDDLYREVP